MLLAGVEVTASWLSNGGVKSRETLNQNACPRLSACSQQHDPFRTIKPHGLDFFIEDDSAAQRRGRRSGDRKPGDSLKFAFEATSLRTSS